MLKVTRNLFVLLLLNALCLAVELNAQTQMVSGSLGQSAVFAEQSTTLTVSYSATDADGNSVTTTGLGLRIHYNSSVLQIDAFTERLFNGAQPFQFKDDTADFDNDPTTDKFYLTSWADVSGSGWPVDGNTGQPLAQPVDLYTVPLSTLNGFIGTTLRFSVSSNSEGFVFSSENIILELLVDSDLDDIPDDIDNCPDSPNTNQLDTDSDGVGDVCDAFPLDSTETSDSDGDGVGDNADVFPLISLGSLTDADSDGQPDNCDLTCRSTGMYADWDDDNDGTSDAFDIFPLDSSESIDTDADGIGNNTDTDDDGDGILDSEDLFPVTAYTKPILESNLQNHDIGIMTLPLSASSEPKYAIGYTSPQLSIKYNLSGSYYAHLKEGTRGTWAKFGNGYVTEPSYAEAYYPIFSSSDNLINFDWSQVDSQGQINGGMQVETEIKYFTRVGVISKTDDLWQIAYEQIAKYYVTGNSINLAIDPTLPIKEEYSDIESSDKHIISDDYSYIRFTVDEVLGTWMIGTIFLDDASLSAHCTEGYSCADVVQLNTGGTGIAVNSGRPVEWNIDSDGFLILTLTDNNSQYTIRRIAKGDETSDVLVTSYANNKYFGDFQMMVKRQGSEPSESELLLDKAINSGFYVTQSRFLRSEIDGALIEFFGYKLNSDGTGIRINTYLDTDAPKDSSITVRDNLKWEYSDWRLISNLCFITLQNNDGEDYCPYIQRRIWDIMRVTDSRMYVMEILELLYDQNGDGNTVFQYQTARPNFWEYNELYDLDDIDRDGVLNANDVFILDATESVDTDNDGIGNNADTDDDDDGVLDSNDYYPLISIGNLTDTDGDGIPDDCDEACQGTGMNADTDDDNDGVLDSNDYYPLISLGNLTDTDGDGIPDDCDEVCQGTGMIADTDDDNDGVEDSLDAFPLDATESIDTDADGIGNNADTDDDNDGVLDSNDYYPLISLGNLIDTDGDGIPDDCDEACRATGMIADIDDDNDGVEDSLDAFPLDPSESSDSDNDGLGDNADAFPNDSRYKTDSDGDGIADLWELSYGFDVDDPNDALTDYDNDSFSELDEFIADTIPLSVDIDGDLRYDALTDGLLILRGMFGLDGTSLVTGTVSSNAQFDSPEEIIYRLNRLDSLLDADDNGRIDALTDGLLVLRYLFGLSGETLTAGVVAANAKRSSEEILAHLNGIKPTIISE